jgi:hypothetical protein
MSVSQPFSASPAMSAAVTNTASPGLRRAISVEFSLTGRSGVVTSSISGVGPCAEA